MKEKNYNFDQYNVFLAFATNIPQRLKTGGPGSQIVKCFYLVKSSQSILSNQINNEHFTASIGL